jgi:hypothetical protein
VKYHAHTAEDVDGKPLLESSGKWQELAAHEKNTKFPAIHGRREEGNRQPREIRELNPKTEIQNPKETWTRIARIVTNFHV